MLSFFDQKAWNILYAPDKGIAKVLGTLKGFFRRINHLFLSLKADYVFIHREAMPIGPPIFEWLLTKILRKKIIHEYDDAIWLPGGEKMSWFKKMLKATWKVKLIIKWSYKISAGNNFLCDYARQYNSNVFLVPSVVDTQNKYTRVKDQEDGNRVVVGWTGSHTTLHNLEIIEKIIPELKKEIDFDFLIISNKAPDWQFDFIFKKWEEETELEDLLKMNIGVMPLKSGPWFEGKCGFKLIQYLACGIPAVASPVGVNTLIVQHEENGFIAGTKNEWLQYLRNLIINSQMRLQMGINGRNHIVKEYSLSRHIGTFLNLFND